MNFFQKRIENTDAFRKKPKVDSVSTKQDVLGATENKDDHENQSQDVKFENLVAEEFNPNGIITDIDNLLSKIENEKDSGCFQDEKDAISVVEKSLNNVESWQMDKSTFPENQVPAFASSSHHQNQTTCEPNFYQRILPKPTSINPQAVQNFLAKNKSKIKISSIYYKNKIPILQLTDISKSEKITTVMENKKRQDFTSPPEDTSHETSDAAVTGATNPSEQIDENSFIQIKSVCEERKTPTKQTPTKTDTVAAKNDSQPYIVLDPSTSELSSTKNDTQPSLILDPCTGEFSLDERKEDDGSNCEFSSNFGCENEEKGEALQNVITHESDDTVITQKPLTNKPDVSDEEVKTSPLEAPGERSDGDLSDLETVQDDLEVTTEIETCDLVADLLPCILTEIGNKLNQNILLFSNIT